MKYEEYAWTFEEESVVKEFDKHIRQSIPMYDTFHKMIRNMSRYAIQDNSKVVDIGCSTGYLLKELQGVSNKNNVEFIGLDTSAYMIEFCKKNHKGNFINTNATDFDFTGSSFITSVLCLQFCKKEDRRRIVESIYRGLKEDGMFVVVEKVKTQTVDVHDMYNDLYYDFKREQGLTDKEIIDKNVSLRGIMKPMTMEENLDLLREVGFKKNDVFFKYNNFMGIVAVK